MPLRRRQQVHMVAHQHIRMHIDGKTLRMMREALQIRVPVVVAEVANTAIVSALNNVLRNPR